MVQITSDELGERICQSEQGRRMPYLCALNRSMGWRILPEGITELTKGLRTYSFDLPGEDNYITSMTASERNGILAIGSAQRRNRDGNSYTIYFVRDCVVATDNYSVHPQRFELLHEQLVDNPVHSLDWCGSHLLVGSKNGITALYSVHDDPGAPFRVTKVAQYTIPFNRKALDVVVPDKFPFNSIVYSVEFASDYSSEHVHRGWQPLSAIMASSTNNDDSPQNKSVSSRFLNTFYNTVNVWDALSESSPKASFSVSDSLQTCASWSPHQPHSLIVTGGCNKALQIIDSRAGQVVWEARDAHARPIRDAKFNNFIPYWLASAGEDCIVNIFDIRAVHHAPVAKIDGHNSVVQSIAWSNMRPENLATASRDRTMRMWMLTSTSVAAVDAHYSTAKWTKYDTRPTSLRDQCKLHWNNEIRVHAPWIRANEHYYYDDRQDPWGHSDELEASTMLLPGAIGLGEWGSSDEGPVYIGEDFEKSRGPVVCVKMSKTRLSEYYCATGKGQVTVQACHLEKRDNLDYRFEFDKKTDPLAYDIEYNLYVRQITRAQEKLDKLKKTLYDDPEAEEHRKYLVDYFEARLAKLPEISPTEWSIDSIPNLNENRRSSRRLWNRDDLWDAAINAYQKDLDYYSRRLPSGMKTRYNLPLDSELHVPQEEMHVSSGNMLSGGSGSGANNSRSSVSQQSPPATPGMESFHSAESKQFMLDSGSPLPSPSSSSAATMDTKRRVSEPFSTSSSPTTRPTSDGILKQNRFLSRSKTLKRMFSRRSSNKGNDSNTEQQNPVVPPWQLRRSQTSSRRNAL